MKAQKFYPRQALRKLQGEHARLDAGQLAALKYLIQRGRKLGYSVTVTGPTTTITDLLLAASKEAADAILRNRMTRIILRPSV